MAVGLYLRNVVKAMPVRRVERGSDRHIRTGWQALEVRRPSHHIVIFGAEPDEVRKTIITTLQDET
jgi:hypothetical protein